MKKNIALIIVSVVLFFIPFLLWGNHYILGGDDTKLYYRFPLEYLQHFTFNIISDNTLAGASTGYDSPAYHAPFFLFLLFLKQLPILNPQLIMYGLDLSFGFLFFYLFLGFYIEDISFKSKLVRIVASLFYIFSAFLMKTFYTNQLIALYLVMVIPCVLYLFLKGIKENKIHYALLVTIVVSVFSPVIVTLPWLAGTLLTLSPIIIYESVNNFKNSLKFASLFIISFIVTNIYWIFHFINASVNSSGLAANTSLYTSKSFLDENIRIVTGVARLYSPLNQLFNTLDLNFFKDFYSINSLNITFIVIIITAGYFLSQQNKNVVRIYAVAVGCLLLSAFFISPNYGEWSVNIFVFFTQHVPLFSMFRNMFDKFALGMAFSYAFLFTISLSILMKYIKRNMILYGLYGLISLLLVNNCYSFYLMSSTPERKAEVVSGEFNKDFMELSDYLATMKNPSRVLWLPMNAPTYVYVSDPFIAGHYYSGTSPLRILSNRSDLAGRFSFLIQNDLFYGDKVFNLIASGDFDSVGKIFQKMNAKYIIVDKSSFPGAINNWYFSFFGKDMYELQTGAFEKQVLGKKLGDFGKSYSLYEINSKYFSDKLYLTDNTAVIPMLQTLSYKKNASYQYTLDVKNLKGKKQLVFLDPYYKKWVLFINSVKRENAYKPGQNFVVMNYANGWTLDSEQIKADFPKGAYAENPDGSINVHLILYFTYKEYDKIIYPISIWGFAVILLYEIYMLFITVRRKITL